MRRLARCLFTFCSVVSLLLCVAIVAAVTVTARLGGFVLGWEVVRDKRGDGYTAQQTTDWGFLAVPGRLILVYHSLSTRYPTNELVGRTMVTRRSEFHRCAWVSPQAVVARADPTTYPMRGAATWADERVVLMRRARDVTGRSSSRRTPRLHCRPFHPRCSVSD